jgi:hypothetical protein
MADRMKGLLLFPLREEPIASGFQKLQSAVFIFLFGVAARNVLKVE